MLELRNICYDVQDPDGEKEILHDINLAAEYCSRIVMLKNGHLLWTGSTAEGLSCSRLEALYDIPFERIEHGGRAFYRALAEKE